jgi:hypothetical protein
LLKLLAASSEVDLDDFDLDLDLDSSLDLDLDLENALPSTAASNTGFCL